MQKIPPTLPISLGTPPCVHRISLIHIPKPHNFELASTEHWGLDIWDCHGCVEIVDRGLKVELHPGDMLMTPAGSHVRADFPQGRRSWYASFLTPGMTKAPETIAMYFPLHEQHVRLAEAMRRAEHNRQAKPTRSVQLLWGILLDLVDLTHQPAASMVHPTITAAVDWIEAHLAEPFSVSELATAIHVSRTALAHLFRQHLNQSISQYIRRLRASRAEAMLTQTHLPIKEIAICVGLPDPQHFNKTVRRQLGMSPSAIRRQTPS